MTVAKLNSDTATQQSRHPGRRKIFSGKLGLGMALLFSVGNAVAQGNSAAAAVSDFALRSTSGENLRLSEYRGEVVIVGFWARWCGDCRQAMKALSEINSKYQKAGLVTLGINVDDTADQADAMARSLGLNFPTLIDDHKAASNSLNLNSMPLIVLIDREGRQRFRHTSYELGDESRIANELRGLLNE